MIYSSDVLFSSRVFWFNYESLSRFDLRFMVLLKFEMFSLLYLVIVDSDWILIGSKPRFAGKAWSVTSFVFVSAAEVESFGSCLEGFGKLVFFLLLRDFVFLFILYYLVGLCNLLLRERF